MWLRAINEDTTELMGSAALGEALAKTA